MVAGALHPRSDFVTGDVAKAGLGGDNGSMVDPPAQTRLLLSRMGSGDEAAAAELLEALYADLRGLAGKYMAGERTGHTLQPTALVHEAWMRVAPAERAPSYDGRAHFVRTAARAMRNILVDHARARKTQKRGQGDVQNGLDEVLAGYEAEQVDVLELNDVLERLTEADPELGRVVELRFFGGQTLPDIAQLLGVSLTTAERRWRMARAWLRDEMAPPG